MTQPLLLEQLREWGILISSGQLSHILTKNHQIFHQEKEDLLSSGKQHSSYLQTDDTGARHNGKNGYCTFIGNEWFSFFESTNSKSRINFLKLLNGSQDYYFNNFSLRYIKKQGLSIKYLTAIEKIKETYIYGTEAFSTALKELSINQKYVFKTIEEAGLLGHLIEKGLSKDMVIVSDDAGQFNILSHALCWIHIERNLQKIHTYTPLQRKELDQVLKSFWQLYQQLKTYQQHPDKRNKKAIITQFDEICDWQTQWVALQKGLDKLRTYKQEMLVCLRVPSTPLHNNQSERDIREYVKKRKISGSTRSQDGRKARDTFTSLKKTCRKMNISFWDYINDRLTQATQIQYLPDLLAQKINGK